MSRVADIVEEKYLDRLPYLLAAAGLFVVALGLAALVHFGRGTPADGPPVASTASVIVFEIQDCPKCDEFRSRFGKPHTAGALGNKVPLKYFDISDGQPPKRFKIAGEITYAPTAVAFDVYGREVARIINPKSFEAFQSTLAPIARRADKDLAEAQGRR